MKFRLLITFLALSFNLQAEWTEYSTRENGDVYYFDNARMQKEGDQITVWNRVRYKTSVMAASSFQSLLVIDCANFSAAIRESTFYLDKDWLRPAMATDTSEKPWKKIDADSATAALANTVCIE